ncbi:MAG TPA: hypothetical protein VF765_27010 [Polyangiaceae bacterium]
MKPPFVLTATALVLGSVLGWSSRASAQTVAIPQPQPAGFETRPNRSMLTVGLFVFGQPYIASMGIAATSSTAADTNLWIPVVGPWLDLGARPPCSGTGCGTQNGIKVLLAANGILQSFGAFEIAAAFIWPEVVPVAKITTASGASVSLTPGRFGSDGYGVSAVGHF